MSYFINDWTYFILFYFYLIIFLQVKFSVFFNKRLKKLMATKVSLITSTAQTVAASFVLEVPTTNIVPPCDVPSPPESPPAADVCASLAELSVTDAVTPVNNTVDRPPSPGASTKKATSATTANKNVVIHKQQRQLYQGYVAALKESFGFVETVNHDKEIFFHYRYEHK